MQRPTYLHADGNDAGRTTLLTPAPLYDRLRGLGRAAAIVLLVVLLVLFARRLRWPPEMVQRTVGVRGGRTGLLLLTGRSGGTDRHTVVLLAGGKPGRRCR